MLDGGAHTPLRKPAGPVRVMNVQRYEKLFDITTEGPGRDCQSLNSKSWSKKGVWATKLTDKYRTLDAKNATCGPVWCMHLCMLLWDFSCFGIKKPYAYIRKSCCNSCFLPDAQWPNANAHSGSETKRQLSWECRAISVLSRPSLKIFWTMCSVIQ